MTPEDRDFADWLLTEALDAALADPPKQETRPTSDYGYGPTGFLLGNVLRENGFNDKAIEDLLHAAHFDATGDDDQPWTPGRTR